MLHFPIQIIARLIHSIHRISLLLISVGASQHDGTRRGIAVGKCVNNMCKRTGDDVLGLKIGLIYTPVGKIAHTNFTVGDANTRRIKSTVIMVSWIAVWASDIVESWRAAHGRSSQCREHIDKQKKRQSMTQMSLKKGK